MVPGTHTQQQDSRNAARIAGRPEQWRGVSEKLSKTTTKRQNKTAISTQIRQQEAPGDIAAMRHTPQWARDAQLSNSSNKVSKNCEQTGKTGKLYNMDKTSKPQ